MRNGTALLAWNLSLPVKWHEEAAAAAAAHVPVRAGLTQVLGCTDAVTPA